MSNVDQVAFVDSVSATPGIRLSLSLGDPWRVRHEGTEFATPELRRATASTLMREGSVFPAAAYADRVLRLRLGLSAGSADGRATALQALQREIDRPTNILRWWPKGATSPVFFRTIRSAIGSISEFPGGGQAPYREFQLELLAEPFALGLRETVATATISTDPAAVSNGACMDITSVKGDVETPLIIKISTTSLVSGNDNVSLFAIRRRGTPSNAPVMLQAEAMTLGTDTTLPGNDAAMSGSGSNYARCSFSTTTAMATRLSLFWQGAGGAPSVDHRGTYRVFARVRRSVSGDTVNVRLRWGGTSGIITNDTVLSPSGTTISYVDLGLVSAPPGPDPVTDGLSGTMLSVAGIFMDVQAERAAGSGNIDFDHFWLVPADDGFAAVRWGTTSGANFYTVDCAQGVTYQTLTSGAVHGVNVAQVTGGYKLMVSPGQSNRLYFMRQIRAGAPTTTIGSVNDLDVSYFPRYLYIRPAST